MNKEIQSFIKDQMKIQGFKSKGDCYFKRIDSVFMIVSFSIYNNYFNSIIEAKPYCYDDIYWSILGKNELSSKSDTERVFGAYHIMPVYFSKYSDTFSDNDELLSVIRNKIDWICSEKKSEVSQINYDRLVFIEEMDNRIKCIASIANDDIDNALILAKNSIARGDSGEFVYEGKSFFQLLLDKYTFCTEHSISKSVNKCDEKESTIYSESCLVDDVNWQIESSTIWYCEDNHIKRSELTVEQERIIALYAANMTGAFFSWICHQNKASSLHSIDNRNNLEKLTKGVISGAEYLLDFCDGKLTKDDICNEEYNSLYLYYRDAYYSDYFAFMKRKRLDLMSVVFSPSITAEFVVFIDKQYQKWVTMNSQ